MVWPLAQLELQLLLLQTWPAGQVVAQLPQLVASDATQEPPQESCPDAHLHTPLWQVCPPEQALPQTPQLLESELVSTQVEPQAVCPELQVMPVPPVPFPQFRSSYFLRCRASRLRAGASRGEDCQAKSKEPYACCSHIITTYIPGQTELVVPCGEL